MVGRGSRGIPGHAGVLLEVWTSYGTSTSIMYVLQSGPKFGFFSTMFCFPIDLHYNSECLYWEWGLSTPVLWVPLSCIWKVVFGPNCLSIIQSLPTYKCISSFSCSLITKHYPPQNSPGWTENSVPTHMSLSHPPFPGLCVMWARHPSWLIIESTFMKPLLISLTRCNHPSLPFRAEFKFLPGKSMFYRQFSKACSTAVPGPE